MGRNEIINRLYAYKNGAEELVVLDADSGATAGRPIQAIQIPKGHGRLIDGDELVKHLRKDPLFDLVERYGISGVIESRPTILEAEE